MEKTVNIHAAKTQLSKLIERVSRGEEIVIARNGRPVARLVPERSVGRGPGRFAGQGTIPDSAFFESLPEEELALWEKGTPGLPAERAK